MLVKNERAKARGVNMKIYYQGWYGISASISEHRDGTATLIVKAGIKTTIHKTYKSVRVAKQVLSRVSDGTAQRIY